MPGSHSVLDAGHPAPADLRVDDGMLEHVPHVQRAGDVRRRNRERKIRLAGVRFDVEDLLIHPPLGPMRLEPLGFIDFLDFHGETSILARWSKRLPHLKSPLINTD